MLWKNPFLRTSTALSLRFSVDQAHYARILRFDRYPVHIVRWYRVKAWQDRLTLRALRKFCSRKFCENCRDRVTLIVHIARVRSINRPFFSELKQFFAFSLSFVCVRACMRVWIDNQRRVRRSFSNTYKNDHIIHIIDIFVKKL